MSPLGLQHRVPLKLDPPLNFCSGGRNDDQGRPREVGPGADLDGRRAGTRVLKCEARLTSFSNRSARARMSSRWVWPYLWMSEARSPGATKVISRIRISAR